MAKTLDEVKNRIAASSKQAEKKSGLKITRQDILDVLAIYNNPKKKKENVEKFLDSLDGITEELKNKVLNDLESYD